MSQKDGSAYRLFQGNVLDSVSVMISAYKANKHCLLFDLVKFCSCRCGFLFFNRF